MSNVLKMEKQALIQQLLALGWSYRRIQKETGIPSYNDFEVRSVASFSSI